MHYAIGNPGIRATVLVLPNADYDFYLSALSDTRIEVMNDGRLKRFDYFSIIFMYQVNYRTMILID